jgi:hypothetical protein
VCDERPLIVREIGESGTSVHPFPAQATRCDQSTTFQTASQGLITDLSGFFLTDVLGTIQITLKQLSRSQAPAFLVLKLELGNENQI